MIQFNLLPDVKLEYIRTQRRKRIATVSATAVVAGSLTILILLFTVVNVLQKRHLSALTKDINASEQELKSTPDLDSIITVQNQLQKLGTLHDQKPVVTRLFQYLAQVTPENVTIGRLEVDFEQSIMSFSGLSDSLASVNRFVDTLKFTTFTVTEEGEEVGPVEGEDAEETEDTEDPADTDDSTEDPRAFSKVVLSSFGRNDEETSYNIDLVFDPVIFDSSRQVGLVVPDTVTTRSEVYKPLFREIEEEEEEQ